MAQLVSGFPGPWLIINAYSISIVSIHSVIYWNYEIRNIIRPIVSKDETISIAPASDYWICTKFFKYSSIYYEVNHIMRICSRFLLYGTFIRTTATLDYWYFGLLILGTTATSDYCYFGQLLFQTTATSDYRYVTEITAERVKETKQNINMNNGMNHLVQLNRRNCSVYHSKTLVIHIRISW